MHSSSEMRNLVNRTAIHVLSQNHRILHKMLHACTSRGATCTVKQGRIVQTQNFIFGRFSNFFYYPNGTWTHPPTSKLFLDFWNFFNFAKPLNKQAKHTTFYTFEEGICFAEHGKLVAESSEFHLTLNRARIECIFPNSKYAQKKRDILS